MNPIIYRIINVICVSLAAAFVGVSITAFTYWLLAPSAGLDALFLMFCTGTIGFGWFAVAARMTETADLYERVRFHQSWVDRGGLDV